MDRLDPGASLMIRSTSTAPPAALIAVAILGVSCGPVAKNPTPIRQVIQADLNREPAAEPTYVIQSGDERRDLVLQHAQLTVIAPVRPDGFIERSATSCLRRRTSCWSCFSQRTSATTSSIRV